MHSCSVHQAESEVAGAHRKFNISFSFAFSPHDYSIFEFTAFRFTASISSGEVLLISEASLRLVQDLTMRDH